MLHETGEVAVLLFAAGCQLTVPPEKAGAAEDAQVDTAVPTPDAAPTPDASFPACMTDPTYSANGPHHYKFYPSPNVDYDTAVDRCAADGAHLIVIDSMEENNYAKSLINGDTWLGFDDLTVEQDFRWITGATGTFRSFAAGKPDNQGGEDCVATKTDGRWDDIGCGNLRRVLCECDPDYRPPPTPLCRQIAGAMVHSGRQYFARMTPRTWKDAEDDCKSIGAHLMVIGDTDENTALDVAFNGSAYWIGFTDAATEGQFQWVDGSPSLFHRFVTSVPANNGRDCAALLDGGLWSDLLCDMTQPYACECDPAPP
jgi:hypothetical protein